MSHDFQQFELSITKVFEHLRAELAALRTGRASAQLLDSVKVDAYGSKMSVSEVASISVPDPTLLVIKPWDRSLIAAIEKAIAVANLNLSPIVDGEIIRVPVPALTHERRLEMVKLLGQKIEAGKVMVRNVRSETKHQIESQKGEEGVSEDDIERDLSSLEDKVQQHLDKIETLFTDKEKELLTI